MWGLKAWRTAASWKTQTTTPCQTPMGAQLTSAQKSSAALRLIQERWLTCGAWGSCCTLCWLVATRSTTQTQLRCFLKSAEANAVCQRACRLRPSVCCTAFWGKNPLKDSQPLSCWLIHGSTRHRHRRKWHQVNRKSAQQNKWCHPLTWKRMITCFVDRFVSAWSGWGTKQTFLTWIHCFLFLPWHFCLQLCVCVYIHP